MWPSELTPVPVRADSHLSELPRLGTALRVFAFDLETRSRKPAFDLKWRRGRFVKALTPKSR